MTAIVNLTIVILFLLCKLLTCAMCLLSGHGHESGWQSGGGGWDRRSYSPAAGAQELAYRSHANNVRRR